MFGAHSSAYKGTADYRRTETGKKSYKSKKEILPEKEPTEGNEFNKNQKIEFACV